MDEVRFPPAPHGPATEAPMRVLQALRPGEQVLWMGRPSTWWRTIQPTDMVAIVAAVGLTVVPLIWMSMGDGSIPLPLLAWWLLCVVAGVVVPVIGRRLSWRKVIYALTDERAFIVGESLFRPLRQVELAEVHLETTGIRSDGIGTLFFLGNSPSLNEQVIPLAAKSDRRYRFDFVAIPDVHKAYDLAEVGTRELR
jgi:hypothetical protein